MRQVFLLQTNPSRFSLIHLMLCIFILSIRIRLPMIFLGNILIDLQAHQVKPVGVKANCHFQAFVSQGNQSPYILLESQTTKVLFLVLKSKYKLYLHLYLTKLMTSWHAYYDKSVFNCPIISMVHSL